MSKLFCLILLLSTPAFADSAKTSRPTAKPLSDQAKAVIEENREFFQDLERLRPEDVKQVPAPEPAWPKPGSTEYCHKHTTDQRSFNRCVESKDWASAQAP